MNEWMNKNIDIIYIIILIYIIYRPLGILDFRRSGGCRASPQNPRKFGLQLFGHHH